MVSKNPFLNWATFIERTCEFYTESIGLYQLIVVPNRNSELVEYR